MAENELILWQGNTTAVAQNFTADHPLVRQSRFFVPSNILMGRYGIVAMNLIDNKPEERCVSYSDSEWIGVKPTLVSDGIPYVNEAQRARHENTQNGFSVIRAFVLPPKVVEVFDSDPFLGEPMVQKCACNEVFGSDEDMDEQFAIAYWEPVKSALGLIESLALNTWEQTGLLERETREKMRVRTWLSFHGWFVYADVISQMQNSLIKALVNFDTFIGRFAADRLKHLSVTPQAPLLPGS